MRDRRHLGPSDEDNFNVMDMKEIASMLTGTTQMLTALLSAVAAVSLLVGGIGIMNIMLVSVTERTREIGIRLAIGALEREVLTQFLVEAVVLSSFGGLIGIVLALAGSVWLSGFAEGAFRLQRRDRPGRLPLLGGGGGDLRLLPGAQGRPSGPHRRAAPRVIIFKNPIIFARRWHLTAADLFPIVPIRKGFPRRCYRS